MKFIVRCDVNAPENKLRLRCRQGFTLVELLVVAGMMAVIIGFAVKKINLAGARVGGATQALATTFLAVQRIALQQQHNVIIVFDSANSRVRIHSDDNSDGLINGTELSTYVQLETGVIFGAPVSVRTLGIGANAINFSARIGGYPAVTFTRSGSATQYGGVYLSSSRTGGPVLSQGEVGAVELDRATGRVGWFRYNGTAWERKF